MTATPTPAAAEPNVCGSCRYYEGPVGIMATEGTCHRYPPSDIRPDFRRWPLVATGDWCGEYQQ